MQRATRNQKQFQTSFADQVERKMLLTITFQADFISTGTYFLKQPMQL